MWAATRSLRAEFAGQPVKRSCRRGRAAARDNRTRFVPDRVQNVYVDDWRVSPLHSVATTQQGGRLMTRCRTNKACSCGLPVLVLVAFSAVIPL